LAAAECEDADRVDDRNTREWFAKHNDREH